MKYFICLALSQVLFGQSYLFESYNMNEFHIYGYTETNKQSLNIKSNSPSQTMIASFLIPGLGQYINNDDVKAFVFIGIEAIFWSIYSSSNSKGDSKTTQFENLANTEFSRIKYYRSLAEESGYGQQFLDLNLQNFENESTHFKTLKNSSLWITLREIEESGSIADGVHMLPETKTQQYYEMIGKYAQFFVGWEDINIGSSEFDGRNGTFIFTEFSDWREFKLNPRPNFINDYFSVRSEANDFYKKADWALRGIIVNHLISGIEAFISSKKRLKTNYQSKSYNGEIIPTLTFQYEL